MNLKPGDLVLVKVDAWKGKREIKDRWDEETWKVSWQIMADVPSYEVMNQHRWSQVLHRNQLLLIASEFGVPLCMGNCHTQDRCTSPTPCKTTSLGGDGKRMPQEKDGKAVTQWPTSKASLGWKKWEVVAWIMDVYWSIHWGWVKITGKVIWLQNLEGTHMWGRGMTSIPIDAGG